LQFLFLFCLACTKFQDFEGEHVEKMLSFSLNYSEILKRNNEQARLAQNEFNEKIKQFTGQDLIETFVEQKKTGVERPGNYPYVLIYESKNFIFFSLTFFYIVPIQFEDIDNVKTPLNLINTSITPDLSGAPSDELIIFDPPETNLPTFQAHFPVASPTLSSGWPSTTNMKKSDSNRGKSLLFFFSCPFSILSNKFSSSSI